MFYIFRIVITGILFNENMRYLTMLISLNPYNNRFGVALKVYIKNRIKRVVVRAFTTRNDEKKKNLD